MHTQAYRHTNTKAKAYKPVYTELHISYIHIYTWIYTHVNLYLCVCRLTHIHTYTYIPAHADTYTD